MIIYKDVPVIIEIKCWHVHKINGKLHRDFTKDVGDVPVTRFNDVTKKFEEVVNHRGNAYATRNRKRFKKIRKYVDIECR